MVFPVYWLYLRIKNSLYRFTLLAFTATAGKR